MPDDVAQAYAIWDSVAVGNVSETARLLDMRRPTVQDWSQRYRWKERQAFATAPKARRRPIFGCRSLGDNPFTTSTERRSRLEV